MKRVPVRFMQDIVVDAPTVGAAVNEALEQFEAIPPKHVDYTVTWELVEPLEPTSKDA